MDLYLPKANSSVQQSHLMKVMSRDICEILNNIQQTINE